MQFTPVTFVLALSLAFLIGAALERGGTCTLGAVAEAVRHRRFTRFIALLEASFFVFFGLSLVRALGYDLALPPNRMFGFVTLIGAAVLGFGAYVNGACPLGTIVHIGRGEADFLLTPLGFYLGGSLLPILASPPALPPESCGALCYPPQELLLLALCAIVARIMFPIWQIYRAGGASAALKEALTPRHATIAAGLFSVSLMLLAGEWTYTDLLLDISEHIRSDIGTRTGLVLAVFGGAIAAGVGLRRFALSIPKPSDIMRRLAGGALMGLGAFFVPGGHDTVLFMHMPLGRVFALCAFIVICGVMAGAVVLGDRRKREKAT
jgi:uncharacterized membrane protein YedE/YeeE